MKRLVSIFLVAMMVMQLSFTVFAGDYYEEVNVPGKLQVCKSGGNIAGATNSASVEKPESDPVFPSFDTKATLKMDNVRESFKKYYRDWNKLAEFTEIDSTQVAKLHDRIEAMHVTGHFLVTIEYDKGLELPAMYLENGNMVGFNDAAKSIYGNDVRVLDTVSDPNYNILKIDIDVVGTEASGRPGYVLGKELWDNIDTVFADITLSASDIKTPDYGVYHVRGKMSGYINAAGSSTSLKVDYDVKEGDVAGTFTVKKPSGTGGGGSGGSGGSTNGGFIYSDDKKDEKTPEDEGDNNKEYKAINFEIDGILKSDITMRKGIGSKILVSELPLPYKDGYTFDGWYVDEECTNKIHDAAPVTEDIMLYGQWKKAEIKTDLIKQDGYHFSYVVGYPEGDVRPENNITREEITAIFFRLLDPEIRESIYSYDNDFFDCAKERWSNEAVSTMANGNYVNGYEDGSFRPGNFITRAEFATIVSNLSEKVEGAITRFTDVEGHWAEDYIADAVAKGWIAGYEDGTFRPDNYITRAEAMTIINRVLIRFPAEDGLLPDAVYWPDNLKTKWYYLAVEEATNTHDFDRLEDGVHEQWTEMHENPEW